MGLYTGLARYILKPNVTNLSEAYIYIYIYTVEQYLSRRQLQATILEEWRSDQNAAYSSVLR
jgi:hypothetical protein